VAGGTIAADLRDPARGGWAGRNCRARLATGSHGQVVRRTRQRTTTAELPFGVGEQRPGDHEDRAADHDDGPLLATAPGDPLVALAEEGVGAPGADRGLADHPCQVRVAVPALPFGRPADSLAPGAKRAHEARWSGGREAAHVGADLGQDHLRGHRPDPGDRIEVDDRGHQLADPSVDAGLTVAMSAMTPSTWCSIRVSRSCADAQVTADRCAGAQQHRCSSR
jgi:hypothetical protein